MSSGITIYLLPGLDGTGSLFDPLLRFSPSWARPRVVRYDPCVSRSYAELTADVSAQIDAGERFAILGESFSGPIAVMSALRHQGRNLRGVVLCASLIANPFISLALAPKSAVRLATRLSRSMRGLHYFLGAGESPALQRAAEEALAGVATEVLLDRIEAIRDVDVAAALGRLTCPVLYLRASRDRVMPRRALRQVLRARPDTSVVRIDSSHLLLQTRPQQAWRAIEGFLQS